MNEATGDPRIVETSDGAYRYFAPSLERPMFTWDKDFLGDPPGSLMLTCPACLRRSNWWTDPFTAEEDAEVLMWRLQAAFRLRAQLKNHLFPFYANRAAAARAMHGSEMPYWIQLQGSQMCCETRAPESESIEGLTAEDLPDRVPASWFGGTFERWLLTRRGSRIYKDVDQDT